MELKLKQLETKLEELEKTIEGQNIVLEEILTALDMLKGITEEDSLLISKLIRKIGNINTETKLYDISNKGLSNL